MRWCGGWRDGVARSNQRATQEAAPSYRTNGGVTTLPAGFDLAIDAGGVITRPRDTSFHGHAADEDRERAQPSHGEGVHDGVLPTGASMIVSLEALGALRQAILEEPVAGVSSGRPRSPR